MLEGTSSSVLCLLLRLALPTPSLSCWSHLPNKLLGPKSLSQVLLWGKPDQDFQERAPTPQQEKQLP